MTFKKKPRTEADEDKKTRIMFSSENPITKDEIMLGLFDWQNRNPNCKVSEPGSHKIKDTKVTVRGQEMTMKTLMRHVIDGHVEGFSGYDAVEDLAKEFFQYRIEKISEGLKPNETGNIEDLELECVKFTHHADRVFCLSKEFLKAASPEEFKKKVILLGLHDTNIDPEDDSKYEVRALSAAFRAGTVEDVEKYDADDVGSYRDFLESAGLLKYQPDRTLVPA